MEKLSKKERNWVFKKSKKARAWEKKARAAMKRLEEKYGVRRTPR